MHNFRTEDADADCDSSLALRSNSSHKMMYARWCLLVAVMGDYTNCEDSSKGDLQWEWSYFLAHNFNPFFKVLPVCWILVENDLRSTKTNKHGLLESCWQMNSQIIHHRLRDSFFASSVVARVRVILFYFFFLAQLLDQVHSASSSPPPRSSSSWLTSWLQRIWLCSIIDDIYGS